MGGNSQGRRELILETLDVTGGNGENNHGDWPESSAFKDPGKILRISKSVGHRPLLLPRTGSPLHMNLQVVNFQRCERAFACPIT